MPRSLRRVVLALLAACAGAGTAHAQGVEFTPVFGSYYPFSKLRTTSDNRDWQLASALFGGRIGVKVNPVVSVDAEVLWGSSDLRSETIILGVASSTIDNGNILFASARAMFKPKTSALFGLVGGGVVSRGGDAWSGAGSKTSLAGVVGLGLRAPVARRTALMVTAQAYLYNKLPKFPGTSPVRYDNRFQQDFMVTVGLPIRLGAM